jgi:hypothetical protein
LQNTIKDLNKFFFFSFLSSSNLKFIPNLKKIFSFSFSKLVSNN